MRIKFWGVRGSTPTPERRNSRYGGNTACVEVTLLDGSLIILDCGSGLRALGKSLLRGNGNHSIRAHIFLTHFHWDHIQGIPFFLPFYQKGSAFYFHAVLRHERDGSALLTTSLKATIEGQMANPYFPVDPSMMGATRYFRDLDGSVPLTCNGARIRTAPLNHPQGCVAYRVEADGAAFVFATDTEPGAPVHDRALRDLVVGADLFVYDAQYTPEQLRGEKKGWGHSSWEEGVRIARECRAKRLVLFHHDPDHDDAFVDGLVAKAREQFPETCGASEGLTLDLHKDGAEALLNPRARASRPAGCPPRADSARELRMTELVPETTLRAEPQGKRETEAEIE